MKTKSNHLKNEMLFQQGRFLCHGSRTAAQKKTEKEWEKKETHVASINIHISRFGNRVNDFFSKEVGRRLRELNIDIYIGEKIG